MPLWVVLAVTVMNWFDRPPVWLELLVYAGLGLVWVLPFRFVFRGIGRPDPDEPRAERSDDPSARY